MNNNKLYLKGIFIQRESRGFKKFNGFCLTFPRLGNIDKALENEIMLPISGFKTFSQALKHALKLRDSISYLRSCPIVNHCDYAENKGHCYTMATRKIA